LKVVRKLEIRSLFKKMFGNKKPVDGGKMFELISSSSNQYTPWHGNLFDSDIIRAAIRPKVNAIGKLQPKHIRGEGKNMKRNSDSRIKAVLEQPNPYMSMQDLLSKLVIHRELTNNAFAYVKYDDMGYPSEIYPIPYSTLELLEVAGELIVKFRFWNGQYMTVYYTDLIHLRKDFNSSDFFGDSNQQTLKDLMEIVNTTDQGIVNAIKNSAIVKWIMMFKNILKPEDQEIQVRDFVKNYLAIDKKNGVAVSDPRYELKQVDEKSYVPNALQMDKTVQRLYSYFGVNENIVQNKYSEDDWNAFYESELEPIIIQLSNAFTKAFFTAREKGFLNRIVFETSSLAYASMSTKLQLVAMVDRGAMTPNEWRLVLNLPPIEGGSKPLRRLDTVTVEDVSKDDRKDGDIEDGEE
jgi:HK97 family phage portal protein